MHDFFGHWRVSSIEEALIAIIVKNNRHMKHGCHISQKKIVAHNKDRSALLQMHKPFI